MAETMYKESRPFTSKEKRWTSVINKHRTDFTQVRELDLFQFHNAIVGTTRGALSDSAGRFTISDVPVGTQVVRATRLGYARASWRPTSGRG